MAPRPAARRDTRRCHDHRRRRCTTTSRRMHVKRRAMQNAKCEMQNQYSNSYLYGCERGKRDSRRSRINSGCSSRSARSSRRKILQRKKKNVVSRLSKQSGYTFANRFFFLVCTSLSSPRVRRASFDARHREPPALQPTSQTRQCCEKRRSNYSARTRTRIHTRTRAHIRTHSLSSDRITCRRGLSSV